MLYNIPVVTLNGIGGKTHPITEAGVLTHVTPQKKCVKFLCYVFDTPVGNAQEILLLGLSTIVDANIDIRYHMSFSVQGISKMIRFLDKEPAQNLVLHFLDPPQSAHHEDVVTGKETAPELYGETSSCDDEYLFPSLMTEIQLKNIVDRLQSEKKDNKTDGDETMVHNGVVISKFSCEALGLGEHVTDTIKTKFTSDSNNGLVTTQCSPRRTALLRY
jgi:hypothetical protein